MINFGYLLIGRNNTSILKRPLIHVKETRCKINNNLLRQINVCLRS